ncbi:STAS domain-containing protein [Nonomuraea sp. NPDC004186]
MQMTIDVEPGYTVMTIAGHISWDDAEELSRRINQMADSPAGFPCLIVDVSGLVRPGSAAIHSVAHLLRRQRHREQGRIVAVGVPDNLRRLLHRAGLLNYLDQCPNRQQAITALQADTPVDGPA